MKKIFSIAALLVLSVTGFAQNEVYFEVGPYEVEYKSVEDYRFRLRKGVDLYDYFKLKKDTAFVVEEAGAEPVKSAWTAGLQYSLPGHGLTGFFNKIALNAGYKMSIASKLYLNVNLNLGLSFGGYGKDWDYLKETMFEAGIPISLEYSSLKKKKPTLYGSLGITPTLFSCMSTKSNSDFDGYENTEVSKSGIYLAPVLGIGGYVPVGDQMVRLGFFTHYNINFKPIEKDVYAQRIGRFVVGFDLGLVF